MKICTKQKGSSLSSKFLVSRKEKKSAFSVNGTSMLVSQKSKEASSGSMLVSASSYDVRWAHVNPMLVSSYEGK